MSFETFQKSQLYYKRSPNLTRLGFNFENENKLEEYLKIQSMLFTLYHIQEGSMLTIMKEFKIPSTRTMDIIFREFEIKSRTLSEATVLSIEKNRSLPMKNYNSFVHIWHTTWNGQQILLRSSHEKAFAEILDSKKILYFVETLRIKYFDKSSNSFKIAIPDFYLPAQHKIVEVKSNYWLDEIQMKSKRDAYRELGYSFDLFLEKQHY